MSYNMKVSIQSHKWIKPITPTPTHLHNHQLSSIDQLMSPKFLQLIFHFDISNETGADAVQTTDPDERLARLEESLSKILTLYYPFAGRYNNEDESTVSCLDQGVDFVVASVDRKLDELVDGGAHHKKDLLCSVDRLRLNSEAAWTPVVLIQVNVFTCGGLAIGLGFNHKVGDMFTISTFMHAWATVSRLGTLAQLVRPSFNISSLLPPRLDFHLPKLQNSDKPLPNFVTKRYIFTGEAISRLKAVVNSEYGLNHTRVELVTALVTKSLVNIGCSKRRPFTMSHAMNLRSRTAIPIEDNSCGNMITIVITAIENEDALELRELAGFVRSSIRNAASEIEKMTDPTELTRKVENASMVFNEEIKKGDFVIFSSWFRFPLYEVDFGWGRPSIVRALPGPGICIWLMDHRSDLSGIEAWVQLKEDDMARFQHEPDIIAYTSS